MRTYHMHASVGNTSSGLQQIAVWDSPRDSLDVYAKLRNISHSEATVYHVQTTIINHPRPRLENTYIKLSCLSFFLTSITMRTSFSTFLKYQYECIPRVAETSEVLLRGMVCTLLQFISYEQTTMKSLIQ